MKTNRKTKGNSPEAEATASAAKVIAAPEADPQSAMVTIIKTGTAAKLSPRGDGQLTFQVGRVGDAIHLRIYHNESAGRFSKEWVPIDSLRAALGKLPKNQPHFKAATGLRPAWKGQSACNSGFGAAILKSEGVLVTDVEKKGMMRLAAADALDKWEQVMLAIKVPKGAEQVPLFPPKPTPNFSARAKTPATSKGAGPVAETADQSDEKSLREDEKSHPAQAESESTPKADAEDSADPETAPDSGEEP